LPGVYKVVPVRSGQARTIYADALIALVQPRDMSVDVVQHCPCTKNGGTHHFAATALLDIHVQVWCRGAIDKPAASGTIHRTSACGGQRAYQSRPYIGRLVRSFSTKW